MFGTLQVVATQAKDFILAAVRNMSIEERRALATTLLDKGFAWVVAHNLTMFANLGYHVAERLVKTDADLAGQVMRHLSVFGLSEDEKRKLMHLAVTTGQGWAIERAVRDLPLDTGFARVLMAHGYERIVGEHLALFRGYTEQQFHDERLAWQKSYDLRRAPGLRYGNGSGNAIN